MKYLTQLTQLHRQDHRFSLQLFFGLLLDHSKSPGVSGMFSDPFTHQDHSGSVMFSEIAISKSHTADYWYVAPSEGLLHIFSKPLISQNLNSG